MNTRPVGVSVLVCTYNGAGRIKDTLAHLACQKVVPGLAWEVILVDNASTDQVLEVAQSVWAASDAPAPLRSFTQPKPGKNYALELAYEESSYSYMCIVDDDNWLAPDYIQNGFDLLQSHPEVGILGGRTTGAFEVDPPAWFKQYQHYYAVGTPILYDRDVPRSIADGPVIGFELWGAGLFARRIIWEQMLELGFETLLSGRKGNDLVAGEDHEFCYVARLLGYKLWYSSTLSLVHYMTKGRLTTTYRDRLLRACAIGNLQLMPYRYALLTKKEESNIEIDLVKELYYTSLFTIKNIFSSNYIGFLIGKEKTGFIISNINLLYILNFAFEFKKIKKNYQRVVEFKNKSISFKNKQSLKPNKE